MTNFESEFHARLSKKLENAIFEATREIVAGGAYVPDFANYQYRVGFLRALTQCLDLCAEVETEMNR